MATTPPPDDRRTDPEGEFLPLDPVDTPPGSEALGHFAAFDSQPTDVISVPEGVLDDLPPAAPSSGSLATWLGGEDLSRDESDVIRGLTTQPPPPGSSNIFDTGPGGSSRFRVQGEGTEHITAEQPRPSNDVLHVDRPGPGGYAAAGSDLFGRPGGSELFLADDPPGPRAHLGGPDFDALDTGDEGSNLFADPTAADLDLDPSPAQAAAEQDSDRLGPGSSIFSGPTGPDESGLDVDRIPIMASGNEGRTEDLPFDAPPPSLKLTDLLTAESRPDGSVGFDMPAGGDDPNATDSVQRSRRITASESAELDAPGGVFVPADPRPTLRKRPAGATGRAPVPADAPAGRSGRLLFGAAGLALGAGATAAAAFFGGFLSPAGPAPSPPVVAAAPDRTEVVALGERLAAAEQQAETERKRRADEAAAATARLRAVQDDLQRAKLPDPAILDAQRQLVDRTREAEEAKSAAAVAAGKLQGTTAALTAAEAKLTDQSAALRAATDAQKQAEGKAAAAEAAVAGVVAELKANNLLAPGDDAAAALAKLPAMLKSASTAAVSGDARKAAEALAGANARAEAARTELAAANAKAADAAAAAKAARDELAAVRAKTDERVKAAEAAAAVAANKERADAQAREAALRQQVEAERRAADERLARAADDHRRQLADARSGVAVPLVSAEVRARDAAAADLDRGITAYTAGRFAEARAALDAAVRRDDADARSWYLLGLARWQLGDPGADAALRKGGDLERAGRTSRREVNDAFLRVQGYDRQVLNRYRP